jgi:protein-disulfide isomerase
MSTPASPEAGPATGRRRRKRRLQTRWVIAVMAVALTATVVVIVASALLRSGGDGGARTATEPSPHLCASGDVPISERTCGDDSAPVKIIEFSDYQCPFCKRFVDGTEPSVETEYVQKGLVQLEFRNLAITGGNAPPDENESTLAAESAECANDQGRFWEYHYKLYAEQSGENRGAFAPERLKQFAGDLGLDQAEFDDCLDSHKHIGLIEGERSQAAEVGARATPSFLIDGKLVVGYMSFDKLRSYIEEALAEQ